MHVDCFHLSCFTLIVPYPAKCLTEREGVEPYAGYSHATAKAEQAEEREGGRESSTCS